jgi:hypothetical protein
MNTLFAGLAKSVEKRAFLQSADGGAKLVTAIFQDKIY